MFNFYTVYIYLSFIAKKIKKDKNIVLYLSAKHTCSLFVRDNVEMTRHKMTG